MNKGFLNFVHWLSVGTGVIMGGAAALTSDPKLGTAAVAVVAISGALHKVLDAMDKPSK